MKQRLAARLERASRQGWLTLLAARLECALHPEDTPAVHASGPVPYRVLLLGGGPAVGLGVSRQDRALPGHLARHLASITGRGVDLDITAGLGMTVAGARTVIEERDLTPYDAVVLTLGVAEALTALPAHEWRERLEPFLAGLLVKASAHTRIVLIGSHHSSWSPYLNPVITRLPARRLEEFNRISRELCWALPRTSYLAPVAKRSPDVTQYSVLDYDRLGRAAAGHLADRLARETAPGARAGGRERAAGAPTLADLGLLGLGPDTVIDRVVRRTRWAFGVEGAALTVLGPTEVWPGSTVGPQKQDRSPRLASLDAATARERGGLAIRNLHTDPRFHDSPLARRHRMAFYAGYPVHAPTGECVAVLAIFDPQPRTFSGQEMTVLRNHALLIQEALTQRPASLAGAGTTVDDGPVMVS